MQLLDRALLEKDATIAIAARANDLLVHTQSWTIFSRLVEGRYPNWRQVLPKRESAIRIELTVGPFFAAIRQAAIVADHDSRGIDLSFDNGTLKMESNTANVGESHVELPVAYSGAPLTVTLDHRYVSEFCKVLQPESTVTLEIESRDRPAMLTTTDGYAYVIMPMAKDR
jgi:DNA polymerase-3 subunit beta